MRRHKIGFAVAAVWSALAMLNCTAILGVSDVPDVSASEDGATPDAVFGNDAADASSGNDGTVVDNCAISTCAPEFTLESTSLNVPGGDATIGVAYDSSVWSLDLADAQTTVTSEDSHLTIVQQASVQTSALFTVQKQGVGEWSGYITGGDCPGAPSPLSQIVTFTSITAATDDAGIPGCTTLDVLDASASIVSGITFCFAGSTPYDAGPFAPTFTEISDALQQYLEPQYKTGMLQVIGNHSCLRDE